MKNFFKKLSFVLALAMVLTSLYVPADASAAATNFVVTKHSGKSYSKSNPLYIYIGGFVQNLDYSINGKKSGVAGTWESSKPAVVDVDAKTGVLTAKKLGSAVVTFTTKDGKTKVATAVKVRARAASAKFYVKGEDGTNTVIDSIDVEEGATAEVRVALPVNKKAKAAGATKSSYFVQETEVADTAIASVEQAGEGYMESRILTISGKTDGTTTLTITANSETKNAKYEKTAELTINVGSGKITAEQAGANTIKVTGKGLTDVVADYVVKKGNVVVNIKSVALNDAKTEATLTAAASKLQAGTDYTLSFKEGDAVAFSVVSATVAKIIIDPETAVKTSTNTAVAYYKVENEFGEDITKMAFNELTFSGSDTPVGSNNGTVKFTSAGQYTPGLSQVSLVIVDSKNGVNVSKILPVGGEAMLSTVEFKGVYSINGSTIKKVDALTEGDATTNLYLVYAGKDQYGMTSTDGAALTLNVASATGLTTDNTFVVKTIDGAQVIAKKLTGTLARGGAVTILAVNTKNGNTDSQSLEVAAKVKIDSFTVSADVVYGGKDNVLNFTAIDTQGNEVTSYNAIKALLAMSSFDNTNGSKVKVARNADGTAKLIYTAASNNATIAVPAVLTFMSETMKVSTVQLSIQPNPVVAAISGVKKTVALAKTVSGNSIEIAQGDMLFVDQYGNAITDAAATAKVKFNVAANDALAGTGDNQTAVSVTGTKSASTTVIARVDGLDGSEYSFDIALAGLEDVSGFAISDIALKEAGKTVDPTVTGSYNGVTVTLVAGSDYTIRNNDVPTIAASEGVKTKDGSVTVVIGNRAGSIISKAYEYSNAPQAAKTVALVQNPAGINAGSAAVTADFTAQVEVKDQYGNVHTDFVPYLTISGFAAEDVIDGNSTKTVSLTVNNDATNSVHVVYNYGSVSAEFDIVVNH